MARRKTSQDQKTNNNTRAIHRKIVRWMWILTGVGILLIALLFLIISYSNIPSFEELENPDIDYASIVYSADGKELGRFFEENRVAVPFDSLNPYLVNALISTEDARYYSHSGIDFIAVARVIVKTILLGQESAGGGSTITQQLAKQLYDFRDFSGMNDIEMWIALVYYKFKEWVTAVLLERAYTKEEIIAMYLNEYDFIYSSHGIEAASRTYFGKEQEDLKIGEAATLIGMLKNAVLYNPKMYPHNAEDRRDIVLYQMEKAGHLTEEQLDSLQKIDLDISDFHRASHITGDAAYFRSFLSQWLQNLIETKGIKKSDGTLYNIYTDGLKIYTTINSKMQVYLQQAVRERMEINQENLFEHWEDKNLWEYKYGPYSVDIKMGSLKQHVRQSPRYRKLQVQFLSDDVHTISKEFNLTLRDYDLLRMVKSEESNTYLKDLEEKNYISEEKADIYRAIIASDYWPAFKSDWDRFQKQVEKEFNTPVKMTVFAYDEDMQKDTVMTPLDSIKYHRMILQVGSLALDPKTGHIKAWVGGIGHKFFRYGHIYSRRQVGSTFKPFVYCTAIAVQGFSPCFPVLDIQYTIQPGEGNFHLIKPWKPQNTGGEFTHERMTLFYGLSHSVNSIVVYLMKQLGDTDPVRGLLNRMGIDSSARLPNGRYVVPKQPSIALGAADLSVMQMTGAYSTFANNGKYTEPVFINKIVDRNGKVLYKPIPHTEVAINSTVNYVMVEMLRHPVEHYYPNLRHLESDIGGKTGTSNYQTDTWYMGISPDIVVGTWVGGNDRWIRFRNVALGQGATLARPIYFEFMKSIEADKTLNYDEDERFYRPPGELSIETDCDLYRRNNPSRNTKKVFDENKEQMKKDRGFF